MTLTKNDLTAINKLFQEQRKAINQDVDLRFQEQRKAINQDVGDLITDNILLQIDELSNGVNEISNTTDRIERRLEQQQDRADSLGLKVEKLEKIHPHGKHVSRN